MLQAIKTLTSQTNSAVSSMATAGTDIANAAAASVADSKAESAVLLTSTAQAKGEAASDVARSAQSSTVVADSKAESAVTLLALRASSAQSSAAVADSKAVSAYVVANSANSSAISAANAISVHKSYMEEMHSRVTAGSAVGSAVSVAIASGGTQFKIFSQLISKITSAQGSGVI